MKSRKVYLKFALVLLAVMAIWWLGCIAKCEILTHRYGDEFDGLWKEQTMLVDPEYWKVLKYSDSTASVYYVSPDDKGGTVLNFVRDEEAWVLDSWGPYWSKSGTADDLIWPYIR